MRLLSPLSLIVICWSLTGVIAGAALAFPQSFDLVPVFMAREELDRAAFTWLGALWLFTAFAAWTLGDLAARSALPRGPRAFTAPDLGSAARLTFLANGLLLGVTLLWITLTALQMGGLRQLILLTAAEAVTAREFLLQNKLFTGMRLFYAALPATGCLAAAILAAGRGTLPRAPRRLCQAVLLMNAVALALLPIVMSQRLLLLQFTLSAYLAACLIRRRIFGLPWLILGAALFLGVWTLREALTNPTVSTTALPIGLQKLAFYMVNDLWNGFAPLSADTPLTWGGVSLRGLSVLTFTDGWLASAMAPLEPQLDAIKGGGDFPLFTAPFVDFGAFGGAALLLALGFALRLLFHRAQSSLLLTVIYAQFGAALMFSSHGVYLTHQNLLASLLVVALVLRRARPVARPSARIIPLPCRPEASFDAAA